MATYSLLKTVSEIQQAIPALTEWLTTADKYLAHTHPVKPSEKFEEHVNLVNKYFQQLCEAHGIDTVLDKLIIAVVEENFQEENRATVSEVIKALFVHVIHFHDFGKVNENFQAEPKKMNNPLFKLILDTPLGSSHSSLGAYLFVVKHMQDNSTPKLGADLKKLFALILLLSYSIFKHHAPELAEPANGDINFGEEVQAMKNYLQLYQFSIHPALAEKMPPTWQKQFFEEFDKVLKVSFPLFALLKLNFSLLTAADYLATHEYMSDAPTTDFGVFSDRSRVQEIITAMRQSKKHNCDTFSNLNNYQFKHPKAKSLLNLNQLRQEMAVEVIRTVRANPDKNLYYIEAPTGGGKTNLSMIAVTELLDKNAELNKVYYVFPFNTLITQTYQVLKETLELLPEELVELHAKASFPSKQEAIKDGQYGTEKQDFIDRLFALYPLTVLSHVKFFDILKSNRKESNYLLHRLANSVVIIDELQSYNPAIWDKMLFFISQYAEFFNIRFVLMSATLPKISSLNIALSNKPDFTDLIPDAKRYLQNPNFAKRVEFKFDLFEDKIEQGKLAEIVIEKSIAYAANNKNYHSVHAIIEFIYKKSASAFHQLISGQAHPFDKIFVLSGTILEPRRKFIINYLKNKENRSKNILLITTQVVEAGVDIDMDLGFKNVSLLDSDEQLAGRVNRNAGKNHCEVYLFKLDEATLLYGKDERYKITRDKTKLSQEQYKQILQDKNFEYLYNHVFKNIDIANTLNFADNFPNGFLPFIQSLNYRQVDKSFKIIDQQNESVFVPLDLTVYIVGTGKEVETVFSETDLKFLSDFNAYQHGEEEISGAKVWQLYEDLIHNRSKGFNIREKVNFKILQSIMSKFTFSLLSHSKDLKNIVAGFGEEKYGYIYFSHWNEERTNGKPYSLLSGLNADAFSDANFI